MTKILIAGDYAPHDRVATQMENGDSSCLDDVKAIIKSADYSIVNFESPVVIREAKPIKKTGPNLNCSEKAMECVARAGFDCVTLANNHFRDFGQIGVEDTIGTCSKFEIDYVGGGKTRSEAGQILYKVINGRTLAVINVCEHEWSIASDNHGGSNPLEIIATCHAIKQAKEKSDYLLVIVHGGIELYDLPTPRMKETYRFFIENGADAVINHHQHCYSGYEIYQDKPIFYGLGNFCFDNSLIKPVELWTKGYMVEIEFADKINFQLIPYTQCDETKPAVQIMENTNEFFSNIGRLNAIIADDTQLKAHFEQKASEGATTAKNLLVPYTSLPAKKLQSKGLLPSFVNEGRLRQLLAHIQCESHRDVLLHGLKQNHDFN